MSISGYVYVISDGERCKIGYSKKPEKRIKIILNIHIMNDEHKFISEFSNFSMNIERQAHEFFNRYVIRSIGREWFDVPFELAVIVVKSLLNGSLKHMPSEKPIGLTKETEVIKLSIMNNLQFEMVVKEMKIKSQRIPAVYDVIFKGINPSQSETKYGLTKGVIQRDVDRVKSLYLWAVKLIKIDDKKGK